jgi:CubicO group peptidase (beta-lactamase class C family)
MWCHTGYFGSFAIHDPSSGMTAAGLTNQAGSEWPSQRQDDFQSAVMKTATYTKR